MFCVGPEVTKENFIGREKELNTLFRAMKNQKNISIYGMARTGKSSLVAEAVRRISESPSVLGYSSCFFKFSLTKSKDSWKFFFRDLKKFIMDKARSYDSVDEDTMLDLLEDEESIEDELNSAKIDLNAFARLCTEIYRLSGQEIWLIVDEMDYANEAFGIHIQELRELINKPSNHIHVINISRHSLPSIFPLEGNGSNYPGIISENIVLKGYSAADVQAFCDAAKAKTSRITDEVWDAILYYGGNVPYFLAILTNHIIEDADDTLEEFCANPLSKYREALYYWYKAISQKGLFDDILDFIKHGTCRELIQLTTYGILENHQFTTPYFATYFLEFDPTDESELYEDYISLNTHIEILIAQSDLLKRGLLRDTTSLRKLNQNKKELEAMNIKIQAMMQLKSLGTFVKIPLSFSEYNMFKQKTDDITLLFESFL